MCVAFAAGSLALAAPTASLAGMPVIVVFPFKTADGLDAANGRAYAVAIGNALQAQPGIKVVMADPSTQPSDFLHVTAASGGDYYLSGYIAGASSGGTTVLEQIVSRRSGTAVWGATAHIATAADITDQGPVVHDALMAYATRGYYAIINSTPTPIPVKMPKAKKNGITTSADGGAPAPGQTPRRTLDLPNEAYGFSSAPTAQPMLYASADHPARFAVLAVSGSTIDETMRRYVVNSLVNTLTHHGQPALPGDPEKTKHFLIHPQDTCKVTGAAFLVFGIATSHSTDATSGVEPWTNADYTPMVYDCTAQAYNRSAHPIRSSAFDWKTAFDRATLKATTDFFAKLPGATPTNTPAKHA
jgi:TolB-like protein